MRAVLRSLPVFAPTEVSTITGLPRRPPPSSPFVASYSSACLCAQADVLGSYSPVSGMAPFSRCCADCVNGWYLTRSFGLTGDETEHDSTRGFHGDELLAATASI